MKLLCCSNPERRGFSLLEALLSLGLTALLLMLAAQLSKSMLDMARATDSHDRLSEEVLRCLEVMANEARQSEDWQTPVVGGGSSPELRFRLLAGSPNRLPLSFPATPPGSFSPRAGQNVVRYFKWGDRLLRKSGVDEIVLENVESFSAVFSGKRLSLTLSVLEEAQSYSLTRMVTPLCAR